MWARAMVPNQGISSMEPAPSVIATASEDGKGVGRISILYYEFYYMYVLIMPCIMRYLYIIVVFSESLLHLGKKRRESEEESMEGGKSIASGKRKRIR